jgi:hypothetical protein
MSHGARPEKMKIALTGEGAGPTPVNFSRQSSLPLHQMRNTQTWVTKKAQGVFANRRFWKISQRSVAFEDRNSFMQNRLSKGEMHTG